MPEELESVGIWGFRNSGLESFVAPKGLRTVHQGAFYKCEHLKTVKFNEGLEVLGMGEQPDSMDLNGVFEESAVENVELPSTLRVIEYDAFMDCKNLKNVQLPEKLEYVGNSCFYGSGLESIALPSSIRVIGPYAFCECR